MKFNNLSISKLKTFWKCPTQLWMREHIGPMRPSGAMRLGSWSHDAVEKFYKLKLQGKILALDGFLAVFRENFEKGLKQESIDWKGDDPSALKTRFLGARGLSTKGVRKTTSIQEGLLPRVYTEYLPDKNPVLIEHRFEVFIEPREDHDEEEIKIIGIVDFYGEGKRKNWRSIRDTKFRGRKTNKNEIERDPQLTMYQMGLTAEGLPVHSLSMDEMVHHKDSPVISLNPLAPRKDEDQQRLLQAFREMNRQLLLSGDDPELFGKAPGDGSVWWCSQKWCGWWRFCPNGGGGNYQKKMEV
jgi:hypothetical protein